jgi:hypothetical protein
MKRDELFKKALKVETEVLVGQLLCGIRELTDMVCDALIKEGVEVMYSEFHALIVKEAEERNWDLRYFRNAKNETVNNLFKRVIRNICKEKNVQLSNDSLSRVLNVVRKCYSDECELSAGLYPAVAFFEREKYGIPDDLGDANSCFRVGGCNMGSALWLINEWRVYDRAWFIVFHYQSGSREGYGRCWAYKLPNAVYATNFYSRKFEIKEERFRKVIARLIRKLFGLSDQTRFATGRNAPLPIYLNGDGYVIYEPSHWENSDHVLEAIDNLKSRCLWCNDEVEMNELRKYEEPVDFEGQRVNGLIVCKSCSYALDDMVYCHDCGALVYPDDTVHVDGIGYICNRCFDDGWFYCDECEEPHRREYLIITPSGQWLCEYCASKLGAICAVCGEFVYFDDEENDIREYAVNRGHWLSRLHICNRCAERHLYHYRCECGKVMYFLDIDFCNSERVRDMARLDLCLDCYCERRRSAFEEAFENKGHPSLFAILLSPEERALLEVLNEE